MQPMRKHLWRCLHVPVCAPSLNPGTHMTVCSFRVLFFAFCCHLLQQQVVTIRILKVRSVISNIKLLDGLQEILEHEPRCCCSVRLFHPRGRVERLVLWKLSHAQVWEGTSLCAACPQLEATQNLFSVPLQLWKRAHVLLFQRVGGWHAVVAQPWVTHPATCQGVQPSRTIVAFPLPAAPSWKQNANQRANFSAVIYSFARSDKQIKPAPSWTWWCCWALPWYDRKTKSRPFKRNIWQDSLPRFVSPSRLLGTDLQRGCG